MAAVECPLPFIIVEIFFSCFGFIDPVAALETITGSLMGPLGRL